MLLVMDIGNTNIKTGLFKDGRLQNSWRLRTDSLRTADEYGTQMEGFFGHLNIDTREVDGIIMSSVICLRSWVPTVSAMRSKLTISTAAPAQ